MMTPTHSVPTQKLRAFASTSLRAARPALWLKNLLVFFPLAFQPFSAGGALDLTLTFIAFCAAASLVYVINDIHDAKEDQHHPQKRFRPIASGQMSPVGALPLICLCSLVVVAFTALHPATGSLIVGYLLLSLVYCYLGRSKLAFDIPLICILHAMRVICGWAIYPTTDLYHIFTSILATFCITAGFTSSKRLHDLKLNTEFSERPYRKEHTRVLRRIFVLSALSNATILILTLDAPFSPLTSPLLVAALGIQLFFSRPSSHGNHTNYFSQILSTKWFIPAIIVFFASGHGLSQLL